MRVSNARPFYESNRETFEREGEEIQHLEKETANKSMTKQDFSAFGLQGRELAKD